MALTVDQVGAVETTAATTTSRFYRAIWRWHFYAGLLVVPFMLMLAITGTIYLFKPQLDQLMYRDLLIVEHTSGAALPATQQLAAVQAAYPAASMVRIHAALCAPLRVTMSFRMVATGAFFAA